MEDDARPARQDDGFNVDSERVYRWHEGLPGGMSQFPRFSGDVPEPPSELGDISPENSPSQQPTSDHVDQAEGARQTPQGGKRRRRTRPTEAAMTSMAMEARRDQNPAEMHEPWFSRAEAARYLEIHPNTLDGLRRTGKVRALHITDRKMVYPLSELERFTREQLAQSPQGPVVPPPAPEPRTRRARPWNAPKD